MKIEDEQIYNEYSNFKEENKELLNYIFSDKSTLGLTFDEIMPVLDIIYDELVDNDISDELASIFQFGYLYLLEKVDELNAIYHNYCDQSYDKMEKLAKTINLYFSAIDFVADFKTFSEIKKEDVDKMTALQGEALSYIKKGVNAPKELFNEVDKLSYDVLTKVDNNYETINNFYYRIAYLLQKDLDNNHIN